MYTYIFKSNVSFYDKNDAQEYLMEVLKKDKKWIEETLQEYISLQEIYAMLDKYAKGYEIKAKLDKYIFASATKFAREHFDEYFIETNH